MNPSFTIMELYRAPPNIFEKMIKSMEVYERRLILKIFKTHSKILRDYYDV